MTTPIDTSEYIQWQTPVTDEDVEEEKARVYVKNPATAPKGVQLNTGPRGGLWFDSGSVGGRTRYTPTKLPAAPKGGKGAKPKEEERPKREIGKPIRDAEDLPGSVKLEDASVQDAYMKVFNKVLSQGGSEADALAEAKKVLPKRNAKEPKEAKPEKRAVGQPFNSFDDPSVPLKVRQESEQVKREWILTFNVELKKGGSEADAIQAANEKLPDRKKPKAPAKAPRTSLPKTEESKKDFVYVVKEWSAAAQQRDDHGRFAGTIGAGNSGGKGGKAGAAGAAEDAVEFKYSSAAKDSPTVDLAKGGPLDVDMESHGGSCRGMEYMMAKQGFDKKPTAVSEAQMNKIVKDGGMEMLRGVPQKAYADDLMNGGKFVGRGNFGAGTYAAAGPLAAKEVGDYTHGQYARNADGSGMVMRMALHPKAKVVTNDKLKAEMKADMLKNPTKFDDRLLADPGVYAAYRGYDAIHVVKPYSSSKPQAEYVVVLNRGALAVQKTPYRGTP